MIPGQEERQARNSAGGVSYKLDPWKRLERFLILGSEGGTYYATQANLTKENAKAVLKLIEQDGVRVVNTVVDISTNNRAPKADPGLFVLALAISFGDKATKQAVHTALPQVARIGTHLFTFVGFAQAHRGWGRTLRDAVAHWYLRHESE
jgi:60 kDa SS-A/Ro ribonucleoprotein